MKYTKRQPRIGKICEHCKKDFTVLACISRYKPCRFCSRECRELFSNVTCVCDFCKKEFNKHLNAVKNRGKYGHFCTHKCYGLWRTENLSGKNSPQWAGGIGGVTYYYGSWKKQRKLAKERDGYKCVDCEKQGRPGDRALVVHHIEHYIKGISTDYAHRLENLKTLCRSCHADYHGGRELL